MVLIDATATVGLSAGMESDAAAENVAFVHVSAPFNCAFLRAICTLDLEESRCVTCERSYKGSTCILMSSAMYGSCAAYAS